MFLELKNIGKIRDAKILIDGITVIAGENNSGKSTIGKTLFCIFNSFYDIKNKIKSQTVSSISNIIEKKLENEFPTATLNGMAVNDVYMDFSTNIISNKIFSMEDSSENKIEFLLKLFLEEKQREFRFSGVNFFSRNSDNFYPDLAKEIHKILNIADETIYKNLLTKTMQSEFKGQINNVNMEKKESSIKLKIKGNETFIEIEDNIITQLLNVLNIYVEAVYIDNPYAFDENDNSVSYNTHREHLRKCLRKKNDDPEKIKAAISEILTQDKLKTILEKLNYVCSGDMKKQSNNPDFFYNDKRIKEPINISNVSTGLKTFSIIKTLLLNNTLEKNGTIILDEPEIHLHPEWQIILAELLILIQNEFNMHILITTHSPYFLNATEIYSKVHGNSDKCRYYLSSVLEDGYAEIKDVTTNTELIYAKLSKPFEDLAKLNSKLNKDNFEEDDDED